MSTQLALSSPARLRKSASAFSSEPFVEATALIGWQPVTWLRSLATWTPAPAIVTFGPHATSPDIKTLMQSRESFMGAHHVAGVRTAQRRSLDCRSRPWGVFCRDAEDR